MSDQEKSLLLTVARILRARLAAPTTSEDHNQDLRDLSDALAPFGPLSDVAINECSA
jgi:hypothetical protein